MTILDQILEKVPHDAMIASTGYEGANIILYTKNKSFLMHGGDIIRRLVEDFKKRIELRADSSIRMDAEATLEHVNKTMTKADLRRQWHKSKSATLQICLYKLLASKQERDILNDSGGTDTEANAKDIAQEIRKIMETENDK